MLCMYALYRTIVHLALTPMITNTAHFISVTSPNTINKSGNSSDFFTAGNNLKSSTFFTVRESGAQGSLQLHANIVSAVTNNTIN